MLSKHFSAHSALLPALHAAFSCQSVHIICNIGYREEKPDDFMRGRLAAELPTATTLQSSELTHLHEQIWTTLNNLFFPLYFTPVLTQRDISHAMNLVLLQHNHMWRSQKNIICPDNMVSIRKFQWGIKGKGIALNSTSLNLRIYLRNTVIVDR